MKLLNFSSYEILNEIKFGPTGSFNFEKKIEKDSEGINYVEFHYTNEKGQEKTVCVEFIKLNKIIAKRKDKKELKLSTWLKNNHNFSYNNIYWLTFYEYDKGLDRIKDEDKIPFDKNTDSFKFVFKKMNTIFEILKFIKKEKGIETFLFKSSENDPYSGIDKGLNKRDELYKTYLNYHNINYVFVNHDFDVYSEIGYMEINDFFVFKI
jgi:hypothetical protein